MTRVWAYSAALVVFMASSAMIMASIAMPNWVTYSVTTATGDRIHKTIGLHKSCVVRGGLGTSSTSQRCTAYPTERLCAQAASRRYFCSVWRTTGWLASFSVVVGLAGLVAFAATLGGGRWKRESGWRFVTGLVATFVVVQVVIVSVVAYLFDHDDQFVFPGWRLGVSWYLALAAAVMGFVAAAGLALSAYLLAPEDGYEALEASDGGGALDA